MTLGRLISSCPLVLSSPGLPSPSYLPLYHVSHVFVILFQCQVWVSWLWASVSVLAVFPVLDRPRLMCFVSTFASPVLLHLFVPAVCSSALSTLLITCLCIFWSFSLCTFPQCFPAPVAPCILLHSVPVIWKFKFPSYLYLDIEPHKWLVFG